MSTQFQIAFATAAFGFVFALLRYAYTEHKRVKQLNRSYRRAIPQLIKGILTCLDQQQRPAASVRKELEHYAPSPELDSWLADVLVDIRVSIGLYEDQVIDSKELTRILSDVLVVFGKKI